jgi:hypothetical protein
MSSDSWLSYELGEHRNYISMHTIYPLSDLQSSRISGGVGIWQFCVIHENARIGTDCHIRYNIFIENDVVIGNAPDAAKLLRAPNISGAEVVMAVPETLGGRYFSDLPEGKGHEKWCDIVRNSVDEARDFCETLAQEARGKGK